MVENLLQLISLPEIYLRLQNTIDDPLHSREQIADVITYDPALSARVLRIANSSYYSFPREIETVVSAVGIIGELDLRNLALVTTVVGSMSSLDYRGVDIDAFWLHSLRCAIIARLIARSAGGNNPEILFLAGMLHDLGILVIYQQDPTLAGSIARQMEEKHQLRDQAERELLGFDHAEVGALLIEAWGLSDELAELTRCHHQHLIPAARRHGSGRRQLGLPRWPAATQNTRKGVSKIG
jgi:HD-like signal output (HDOD) protein